MYQAEAMRCSAFSFLCQFCTILATMALAVCCSVSAGSRWSKQILSGSIRQTRVVWSISQLPAFGPSVQYTRLVFILNFFMHSFNSISSSPNPVTAMMFLPNSEIQDLRTLGVSLWGSTETKTIFNFMQAPSGRFLMILYTEERQQSVLGQISGHDAYPKQMRQQYPFRFLLEKGCPSTFTRVQSPPISDSFCFNSFNPEISSSTMSRLASLFLLAEQYMQASAPARMMSPVSPILVTPSYVLPSNSSSLGEVFRSFCCCCIHASCLFLGRFCLLSEKRMATDCVRRQGRGRGEQDARMGASCDLARVELMILLIMLVINVIRLFIIAAKTRGEQRQRHKNHACSCGFFSLLCAACISTDWFSVVAYGMRLASDFFWKDAQVVV